MKIGIIKEGKNPPDSRVAINPSQCAQINTETNHTIYVESSSSRCFKDEEYEALGLNVVEDISHCDLLMGVKEVPLDMIISGKPYMMFSHTIKEQPYNQKLIKKLIEQENTLIDYEVLTNDRGHRVIAFGKFAGMVGAHNALYTYAERTKSFSVPRMYSFHDYAEAKAFYKTVNFPPVKIVLTGTGRVGTGAHMVLEDMGILKVSLEDFLVKEYDVPVYCQLSAKDYVKHKDTGADFEKKYFYENPTEFESCFVPFTKVADIMINGIYWDPDSPRFFTIEDMSQDDFKIEVIADVTCDIAPEASIPSTLKASTIAEPVFGFNPATGEEVAPFNTSCIDVMSIDNLPNELPRDASTAFGEMFIQHVLPEFDKEKSDMLEKATIVDKGSLGAHFDYLKAYAGIQD